jgi:hypothetical protein
MATALAGGVAEEPGITVLGLQTGQATPQQAGGQAAKPGQLRGRGKVGGGLGLLVGHGHSVEKQKQLACSPHRQKIASECLQISGLGDEANQAWQQLLSNNMIILSRYLRLFSMFL